MSAATWAAIAAVVRQLAPEGQMEMVYPEGKLYGLTEKQSTLGGLPWRIAIQNEDTPGIGTTILDAQAALKPTSKVQFQVQSDTSEPYEFFSLARVKGSVMKGAMRQGGSAVVDVWEEEMKAATRSGHRKLSQAIYGDGSGVIGTINSAVAATTITLATIQDIVNFGIGYRLQAVNGGALVAGGAAAEVTGIDRVNGTLTFASNLSTLIPGVANGDTLVVAGTYNGMFKGLASWVVGGTSPGTLYGLNRNIDPARLAGQKLAASGMPMAEALMEMSGMIDTEGEEGKIVVLNNKKLQKFKKTIEGQIVRPRTGKVESKTAGIAFEALEYEGTNGTLKLIGDRFCPYKSAYNLNWSYAKFKSYGPLVQVLGFDSNEFLRVATDDAYEIRNGSYHLFAIPNPGDCGWLENFGEGL